MCTGGKFAHHSCASCKLNHNGLPKQHWCHKILRIHAYLKLRLKVSTEKPSPFSRRTLKEPCSVKLCTRISLHRESQTSKWRGNTQRDFENGCLGCCDGVGYLLYLFHDLLSIRQLVDQSLDDLKQRFGLWSCCLLNSAKQGKNQVKSHLTRHRKKRLNETDFWAASLNCIIRHDEVLCCVILRFPDVMPSSYWGCGCESPLRRFMTSVPRIMARLVRPTPTWQLKRSAGSRRGALWPRDKLVLSWKTHIEERLSMMAD